jgi:hypothetical protein
MVRWGLHHKVSRNCREGFAGRREAVEKSRQFLARTEIKDFREFEIGV